MKIIGRQAGGVSEGKTNKWKNLISCCHHLSNNQQLRINKTLVVRARMCCRRRIVIGNESESVVAWRARGAAAHGAWRAAAGGASFVNGRAARRKWRMARCAGAAHLIIIIIIMPHKRIFIHVA